MRIFLNAERMNLSNLRFASLARWLGPAAAILVFLLLPATYGEGLVLSEAGRFTAGVAVWMAIWWFSECVPIPITAFLPIILFPILGVSSISEAAAPYANEVIYLFFGGFVLSIAMQTWNLHTRIALFALRLVGVKPARVVLGFMVITAVLSMWVSNTAIAVMMLPIAISVLALLSTDDKQFELALLLGIAYSASIGGVGTIIGTPPNVFLVSFVESNLGVSISFVKWMAVGVPFVLVMLPLSWLYLTRIGFKLPTEDLTDAKAVLDVEYAKLGPTTRPQWIVMAVFVATATSWVFRPWIPIPGLSDAGIAMIAALMLFVLPSGKRDDHRLLEWSSLSQMPWGILILFGGGLSLAEAIQTHGVGEFLGYQASLLADVPWWVMVVVVVGVVIFLTEMTSNTATTATLLPILAGVAIGAKLEVMALLIPTAIAASCAFMMPVATPPNAVVFGSGRLTIREMARAGFWLNLMAIVVVSALAIFWVPFVF